MNYEELPSIDQFPALPSGGAYLHAAHHVHQVWIGRRTGSVIIIVIRRDSKCCPPWVPSMNLNLNHQMHHDNTVHILQVTKLFTIFFSCAKLSLAVVWSRSRSTTSSPSASCSCSWKPSTCKCLCQYLSNPQVSYKSICKCLANAHVNILQINIQVTNTN